MIILSKSCSVDYLKSGKAVIFVASFQQQITIKEIASFQK